MYTGNMLFLCDTQAIVLCWMKIIWEKVKTILHWKSKQNFTRLLPQSYTRIYYIYTAKSSMKWIIFIIYTLKGRKIPWHWTKDIWSGWNCRVLSFSQQIFQYEEKDKITNQTRHLITIPVLYRYWGLTECSIINLIKQKCGIKIIISYHIYSITKRLK